MRRWSGELPSITTKGGDVFGLLDLATHRPSLDEAPGYHHLFQKKQDECLTIVLEPGA